MHTLSKIIETIKYYKELFDALTFLIQGVIGIYILKYTPFLTFIEHHPNFGIDLILLFLLYLEFMVALLIT